MNIDDLPFSCSIDTEGLISDISGFEQEKYENKIDNMLTSLGFVDDKDSSERVAKYNRLLRIESSLGISARYGILI